MFKSFNRLTTF